MTSQRQSWDSYFVAIARLVATRSTCRRRQVGAVMVRERRLVACGFNGAPHRAPHCLDFGCAREGLPSGGRLDLCRAVHAEANCIAQAARFGAALKGADCYVTCQPCAGCARLLVQAGVERIVWAEGYPAPDAIDVLEDSGYAVADHEARRIF